MVRLTDRLDMTLDVYCGRKTRTQQKQQQMTCLLVGHVVCGIERERMVVQVNFKRSLNAFTECAETTESGNAFQMSTTRFEKLLDRTLSLARDLYNLEEWHLVA